MATKREFPKSNSIHFKINDQQLKRLSKVASDVYSTSVHDAARQVLLNALPQEEKKIVNLKVGLND